MPPRSITAGEYTLLNTIFGQTLPYDTLGVDTNDGNWGGAGNSITPWGTPYMSNQIWANDYSLPTSDTWTFVHEMTHVWQYYHGIDPVTGFAAMLVTSLPAQIATSFGVSAGYKYDLTSSNDFTAYNTEQQASIVADYWAVSNGQNARECTISNPQASSYLGLIGQVRNSGPPVTPPAPDPSQYSPGY
jgi:hypothetical protein